MSFEIAVKKAEGVERLLAVTVSVETVKAAEDKAVKRYASAARMPGFRPAPQCAIGASAASPRNHRSLP